MTASATRDAGRPLHRRARAHGLASDRAGKEDRRALTAAACIRRASDNVIGMTVPLAGYLAGKLPRAACASSVEAGGSAASPRSPRAWHISPASLLSLPPPIPQ